jgi:hypothetical protein
MERLVRTVENVFNLPDYATMVVCASCRLRYRRGGFGLGDSIIDS